MNEPEFDETEEAEEEGDEEAPVEDDGGTMMGYTQTKPERKSGGFMETLTNIRSHFIRSK